MKMLFTKVNESLVFKQPPASFTENPLSWWLYSNLDIKCRPSIEILNLKMHLKNYETNSRKY